MKPTRKRRYNEEPLSLGDRVVTAVLAALIALVFGGGLWLLANWRLIMTNPLDPWLIPFWPVAAFAGVMSAIGLVLGPQKTMDVFEKIWRRGE